MRDYTNQQKEIEAQEAYINRFRANSAKAVKYETSRSDHETEKYRGRV